MKSNAQGLMNVEEDARQVPLDFKGKRENI
jgi:hypothetical protein